MSASSLHPHRIHVNRPRTPSFGLGITLTLFIGAALVLAGPAEAVAQSADEEPRSALDVTGGIVDGVDYRVYDRAGAPASLDAIVQAAFSEEVVLVGEEHGDVVGHAFEALLFGALLDRIGSPTGAGRPVVLSMEMFERDVQYVLDEYLEGLISEAHFLRSARPWDDYEMRYRDLVERAREAGLPVVAANAPRRYVNRVSREGPTSLTALSAEALRFLPPLPYPGPSATYLAQWDALMSEAMASVSATEGGGEAATPTAPHGNVVQAQALWDAAMGHAITEALVANLGGLVVHFAGSFHVERGTGIPERIDDYRPGTGVLSVVMTRVDDIDAWSAEDHEGLADYVVLTRRDAPVTPEGRPDSGSSIAGPAARTP